jgi:hypothetical protein
VTDDPTADLDLFSLESGDGPDVEALPEGAGLATYSTASTLSTASCPISSATCVSSANCQA